MQLNKSLISILSLLSIFLLSETVHARFKCWTNSDGVRECGETIPPEYAQKGYKVINKMGVKVGEGEHALTEEDKEKEKQQKALARKKAEEEKKRAELAAERRRYDRVILNTYTSEQEILYARDEKIAAIESNIKLTKNRVGKLEENLNKLRQNAAQDERSGKGISDKRKKEIADVDRQIAKNRQYISDRTLEQEQLREEYKKKLIRFRELKAKADAAKEE